MQRTLHRDVLPVAARWRRDRRLATVASKSTDRGRERWLLVTVTTAGASSTLRVHAWRKLRGLGAVYLQQSVAVLPERPETAKTVNRLVDRVRREGGQASVWAIEITDARQQAGLVASFQSERSDEYAEVSSRVPAFLAEIDYERGRGRTTYAEVEESEADLDRLRVWLGRIQARDYFAAPGGDEAASDVARCADALAAFEADALSAEVPEADVLVARPAPRPRLRSVPDKAVR